MVPNFSYTILLFQWFLYLDLLFYSNLCYLDAPFKCSSHFVVFGAYALFLLILFVHTFASHASLCYFTSAISLITSYAIIKAAGSLVFQGKTNRILAPLENSQVLPRQEVSNGKEKNWTALTFIYLANTELLSKSLLKKVIYPPFTCNPRSPFMLFCKKKK